jgi:tripartite-type tricarboxylate transporter receptor subunit TctC
MHTPHSQPYIQSSASMSLQKLLLKSSAFIISAVTLMSAHAQSYPAKPITLVVPFPAGGGTDTFARPLSAQLSKQLNQRVVIDNKGGAGGTLGAGIAAKAAGDGYTLFMGAVHHAIAPGFYNKLEYDIEKDFVPITIVAVVPQVLVVNPQKVAVKDVNSFIDYVKRNPGKLNYGSAGNGTSHHMAGELFKLQTKTFITHIPYRGSGPALQDLVAGQVDVMFDGLGSSAQHIRGGRINALMVAGDKRVAAFPNVPSAKEAGLPDYNVTTWYALFAPKGTPQAVVDQLAAETRKALDTPEMKEIWNNNGSEAPALTGAAFSKFLRDEIEKWGKATKASGAKLD